MQLRIGISCPPSLKQDMTVLKYAPVRPLDCTSYEPATQRGTDIEQNVRTESPSAAISRLMEQLESTIQVMPAEKIGIRMHPFAITDNDHPENPLTAYISLIEEVKRRFPTLGFVHAVADSTFDDLDCPRIQSLDPFRAAVAFPDNMKDANQSGPVFVSSNAYTAEQAHTVAERTRDLVCIGLAADNCPDITSLIQRNAAYRLPVSVSSRLGEIENAFRQGKEYGIEWDSTRQRQVTAAMGFVDSVNFYNVITDSDPWKEPTKSRGSCWFASPGIGQAFLKTEEEISKVSANQTEGQRGLRVLQIEEMRKEVGHLKNILDSALLTASKAVGIPDEILQRCTVRYQVRCAGIGLHADSHLLTAIISGPAIRVYDVAGAIRQPVTNSTIVMSGTTLYRWSEGKDLPTFHELRTDEQGQMSIAAFLDFPDMAAIPRESGLFFHDIRQIEDDDQSRTGELAPLWDIIAERHKLGFPLAGKGCNRFK